MKFSEYSISGDVKRNITKLGWTRPTDIQFKTIPHILKKEDLLAIAQTGTGKTAAFAIPIISFINEQKRKNTNTKAVKCLVMVPTRELSIQIADVFKKLAKGTKVKIFGLYGGVEQERQIQQLETGIDILISTPGRMFDLIAQGYIDLSEVKTLVLDEADHMLALGFIKDIEDVIRKIPKYHQTLFFSATINPKIKKLAYSLVNGAAIRIQIAPKDPVSKNIEHSVAFVEMDDKRFFLERIITQYNTYKILIFVRTKVRAERVAAAMARVNIDALTIHGGKEQKDRIEVLAAFKGNNANILIATDVTARGIDIPDVDMVVNYDIPDVSENYVHRVGRTGRGTKRGVAISFCSEEEKELLDDIQGFLGTPIEISVLERDEYQETLDLSIDKSARDWKKLLQEEEDFSPPKKKKRIKKRK